MLKLIGAILLVSGAAAWGLMGAKGLKDRGVALRAVASSLELMGHELCDMLTPVPELFAVLGAQAPEPANQLYRNAETRMRDIGAVPFSELWRRAVLETGELLLREEEVLALSELGFSLGKYDAAEQRKAIETAKKRFEMFAEKAEKERDRNWKSQAFLGAAAGLFAVIMLL
ncbi:MAG: stage III sporulation protein AB [Oscillospiraceae bacterium]|nr:stage III sporulation protein AB [Oscillospiraceae bacterium]